MYIHNISRVVILCDGYILLTRSLKPDNAPFDFLPGGHIEYGETAASAAIRELREEASIIIPSTKNIRPLGVFEHLWDDFGSPYHEINFVQLCDGHGLDKDNKVKSNEEALTFHWKPLSDLPATRLLPVDLRELIPLWLSTSSDLNFFASKFLS